MSETRLKSKVFSLEGLKKDFGSEEILGLKKVFKKKFWLEMFLVLNTFWAQKQF